MKEVIASALFGLFKGAAAESPESASPYGVFQAVVVAPVTEELIFREGGAAMWKRSGFMSGKAMPLAVSAVPFAVAHLRPSMDARRMFARFVDVFLGGLLYQSAYNSGGLKMSIAAHAAHNLGVQLGCMVGRKPTATPEPAHDGLPEGQVFSDARDLGEVARQLRQNLSPRQVQGARR